MDELARAETIAQIAGAVLLAAGLYLAFVPVAECDKCDHCREERLHRKRWARCPVCLQHHDPSEPHKR